MLYIYAYLTIIWYYFADSRQTTRPHNEVRSTEFGVAGFPVHCQYVFMRTGFR